MIQEGNGGHEIVASPRSGLIFSMKQPEEGFSLFDAKGTSKIGSPKEAKMIENYTPGGCMIVDGKRHCRDLKIIQGQVIGDWWREEGHRLNLDDIQDVLTSKPKVLVIGMGYAEQMRVPDSLRSAVEKQEIRLIAQDTGKAVETFNRLDSEGKKVAGSFHLTC